MIIVEINALSNGSTGNIMLDIAEYARVRGHTVYTFSGDRRKQKRVYSKYHFYICHWIEYYIHFIFGVLFGYSERMSYFSTKRMIQNIKMISPDVIHIHIVHGYYLNIKLLFKYLKSQNAKIVWTFHDCWAITGRCPHFQLVKCYKWKNGCFKCPYPKESYPASLFDVTKKVWKRKKRCFTEVKNIEIVTPSQWLANIIKQSYFKKFSINVINNGINLDIFKPTDSECKLNKEILHKIVVLGVASCWNRRKGLDVFIKLSNMLSEEFKIVLVGTDKNIDKVLPPNIYSVHHTKDRKELANMYSIADIFVNPTREDTFPTVNIEALACGTPVLTFNTGGSPEIIDETCGSVVECDDIGTFVSEIVRICKEKPFSREACINRAKKYDKICRYKEYLELYSKIIKESKL